MLFSRSTPDEKERMNMPASDKIPDHFNWIANIDRLSNGDISKHEYIYNMNYLECLNIMAYWHHRDLYNEKLERQRQRNLK